MLDHYRDTRDYLMTQRWILQPRIEANIAARRVERFGVGRGLNDIELGFCLHYGIRREFAPYFGIATTRSPTSSPILSRILTGHCLARL